MDSATLAMLVFISVLMGAFLLFGVLWGIKNKQFEDYRKFLDGANLDDEDALNEAYELELRKKEALKKKSKINPQSLARQKVYLPLLEPLVLFVFEALLAFLALYLASK